MIVRALTSTGDWSFGQGTANYLTGRAAVAQNIQTRLMMFANDFFFSMSGWIDWFNLLGSKQQLTLQLAITNTILNTAYVAQILDFSIDFNDTARTMSVSYTVLTQFGIVQAVGMPVGVTANLLVTQSGETIITQSGEGIAV